MIERTKLIKAFPSWLTTTVNSLLDKVELKTEHEMTEGFQVTLDGEKLEIPVRIYFEKPSVKNLTEKEILILNCIFTRHHDGFVRESSLKNILRAREYFLSPFIVQLLGEYVIQILQIIKDNLDNSLLDALVKFKSENPTYFQKTEQRIQCYWDCYYRSNDQTKESYPGFQIVQAIKEYEAQTV